MNSTDLQLAWALGDPRTSNFTIPRSKAAQFINIISYCYVLPSICAMGLLGNIANLITLFSRRLKAVSYMYLRGLGIADMLCMIFVLVFVSFEILSASSYNEILSSYNVVWYRAHLMLPLINWTVSAGILIIVALTLERYISISWPMLFREWNSPRRAIAILTGAYFISLVMYIPMCWQNEVVPQGATNNSFFGNTSVQKWTMTDNKLLLNSTSYKAYKLTRETLVKFIPIAALACLNLRIIFLFKKVTKRKRRLSGTNSSATREQKSLLFLLAGIVVLFFICNIPAAINLLFITEAMKKKPSYMAFRAVANLLEITNHALNFYSFCLCSSDYRMTFLRKFPCVKVVQESADNLKRRLSNSIMRASRRTLAEREITQLTATGSLRNQKRGPDGKLLRRAISSDVLLRTDYSCLTRPNRMYRPGQNNSAGKERLIKKEDGKENGSRSRKDRKKYYSSAESFQVFDAIPEDSNIFGPHSTDEDERRISIMSIGKRPAVSAIDFTGANDYQAFMTDMTSGSVTTPFSAITFLSPSTANGVRYQEKTDLILNYNPDIDTLL